MAVQVKDAMLPGRPGLCDRRNDVETLQPRGANNISMDVPSPLSFPARQAQPQMLAWCATGMGTGDGGPTGLAAEKADKLPGAGTSVKK